MVIQFDRRHARNWDVAIVIMSLNHHQRLEPEKPRVCADREDYREDDQDFAQPAIIGFSVLSSLHSLLESRATAPADHITQEHVLCAPLCRLLVQAFRLPSFTKFFKILLASQRIFRTLNTAN